MRIGAPIVRVSTPKQASPQTGRSNSANILTTGNFGKPAPTKVTHSRGTNVNHLDLGITNSKSELAARVDNAIQKFDKGIS